MKTITTNQIVKTVRQLCIDANCYLCEDVINTIKNAREVETSAVGSEILDRIIENAEIAANEEIPICQDTGMAVFFVTVGQDVHIDGGSLTDAINEGVRQGYTDGFLRKSVVADPVLRGNTGDNTPAVIHYDIKEGDELEILIAPKGFGSENMSALKMLTPAEGIEGVKKFVLDTVKKAGPNPCPPVVVGVGIGGTMEKCACLAKKALTRSLESYNEKEYYKNLEIELLDEINKLGIGVQGFGGSTTALKVNVETFATHIAGLPCAVNINCHVARHKKAVL